MQANELVIDDREPAFQYTPIGTWERGGRLNLEHGGTTTYTNKSGAVVTVDFDGNSITIFGTLSSYRINPPTATLRLSFTIQDRSSNTVVPPTTSVFSQPFPPSYLTQLYRSPELSVSSGYRLIIRNESPNDTGFICMDFAQIRSYPTSITTESSPTGTSVGPTTTVTAGPTLAGTTLTDSGTPTSTVSIPTPQFTGDDLDKTDTGLFGNKSLSTGTPSTGNGSISTSTPNSGLTDNSKQASSNKSLIIAGTLGGLGGLLALGLLCYWIFYVYRRRAGHGNAQGSSSSSEYQVHSEPTSQIQATPAFFANSATNLLRPAAERRKNRDFVLTRTAREVDYDGDGQSSTSRDTEGGYLGGEQQRPPDYAALI